MSFQHTKMLDAVPANVEQVTPVLDTLKLSVASMQFTLAGATGPSLAIALQGSNAVPPNGAWPNQGGTGVNAGWEVPEDSWVQIYSDSTAIADTMTEDGTILLGVAADGLLTRWLRGIATPTGGVGGTLTVEYFARSLGN